MFKTLSAITLASIALTSVSTTAAFSAGKFCPPGLAAKNNGCLPPGIAKRYTIGETLPEGVSYELITDLEQYDLLPPDGEWLYYLVDGDILKIADDMFTVIDAFEILFGNN